MTISTLSTGTVKILTPNEIRVYAAGLEIAAGPQGIQGPQGPQGEQGDQGADRELGGVQRQCVERCGDARCMMSISLGIFSSATLSGSFTATVMSSHLSQNTPQKAPGVSPSIGVSSWISAAEISHARVR